MYCYAAQDCPDKVFVCGQVLEYFTVCGEVYEYRERIFGDLLSVLSCNGGNGQRRD